MDPNPGGDRVCLFLDVDGTLIDIAARPESVIVPASLLASLSAAAERLDGALALVSGRTIDNLDRLFAPLCLRASGVHGAEIRFDPAGPILVETTDRLSSSVVDAVHRAASGFPGAITEDKGFSIAVHYRLAHNARAALEQELRAILLLENDPALRILAGHMVFEVKRATFDKGLAISRFMERAPFAGRKPLFFGDDVTDRPGFAAVLERGGEAFSVGQAFEGLSGSFPDPASVRSWLADVALAETNPA